jgi:UDP:flavonoid glycosyltransferase YjiC (YdhE family)
LRAQRLGVARFVLPKRFTGDTVAAALHALLDDPAVAAAAARLRDELRGVDGVALACDALERTATAG